MTNAICVGCGATYAALPGRGRHLGGGFCYDCYSGHYKEQWAAIIAVRKAVRRGELPRASDCTCVDCAKPARDYDHRDYTKPLEVVPVCRSCNAKRGHAFNSFYRPAHQAPAIASTN